MSVGYQLQEARKARHLSLLEAADETKIQPWILESLEADRFHDVVSPMYMRGFLKIYAGLLGLSYDELLEQLPKNESSIFTDDLEPVAEEPMDTIHIPWSALARISSGVAIGFLVIFSISSLQPQKWLSNLNPAKFASQMASMSPSMSKGKSEVQAPIVLKTGEPLKLSLVANKTTRVQLWADGKLLVQQQLKKGMAEEWTAKEGFKLVIAKPNQVELSLNGTSILPAAIASQGRLEITHKGVAALPNSAT